MVEVIITYETLYEVLRREKGRAELQKLDSNFFKNVSAYLMEKQEFVDSHRKNDSMFNAELSRIKREIENIRRIIKELYEKREIKLINISLSNSITGSGHGTENVLEEEKPLYENLLELLNGFRERTLNFLLDGMVMDKPKAIKSEDFVDFNKGMKSQETLKNPFQTSDKQEEKTAENQTTDTITIRLLAAVPKFFGTDGHIYGPFESDDLAELPLEIANLLLKNNRAEKI